MASINSVENTVKEDWQRNQVWINQDCFQKCWDKIWKWVNVGSLTGQLMKHGLMDLDEDYHLIDPHKHWSPRQRADNLLNNLTTKGGRYGYYLLYMCIRDCDANRIGHGDAVKELVDYSKKQSLKPDFIVEVEDAECDGPIKGQLSATNATVHSVSHQDTSGGDQPSRNATASPVPPIKQHVSEELPSSNPYLPYVMNPYSAAKQSMPQQSHGLALIISNSKFGDQRLSERKCAHLDEDNLKATFKILGYQPVVLKNLTATDIIDVFKKLSDPKNEDPDLCIQKEDDSFVCCIMSHGGWDKTMGRDYICGVQNEYNPVYVRDLAIHHLGAGKCKSLQLKPKLFFVNACRGEQPSDLVSVSEPEGVTIKITHECDFLFSNSTFPDTPAYRDDQKGAHYVSTLCDELQKDYSRFDLATILMKVHNRHGTDKDELYKVNVGIDGVLREVRQCPEMVSTLRGPVFFCNEAESNYKKYIGQD